MWVWRMNRGGGYIPRATIPLWVRDFSVRELVVYSVHRTRSRCDYVRVHVRTVVEVADTAMLTPKNATSPRSKLKTLSPKRQPTGHR